MPAKYKPGQTAYILESNREVREVTVVRYSSGMYLIKFLNGGGIQVKEHRLYPTKEDAEMDIPGKAVTLSRRSPYDYDH